MTYSEERPAFRFGFAELETLGDKCLRLIDRDRADLAQFGIDAAFAQTLRNEVDALKNYPTDEEFQGTATGFTDQKNALRAKIHAQLMLVMVRVKHSFGSNTSEARRFGTTEFSRESDPDFCRAGKRVVRVANEYLPMLSAKGLTRQALDALHTDLIQLDQLLDQRQQAVEARDLAAQERVRLANRVYALAVEVTDFGKAYYEQGNPSKYNDYLIYDHPSSKPSTNPADPKPDSDPDGGSDGKK